MIRMWPSCGALKAFVFQGIAGGAGTAEDPYQPTTITVECGRGRWHRGLHRGPVPMPTGEEGEAAWL